MIHKQPYHAAWRLASRALAIAVLAASVGGCPAKPAADASADDEKAPAVFVHVQNVVARQIAERIEASGSVVALPGHGATVNANVAGRVLSLDVRVGQMVHVGQPLARLQQDPSVHAEAVKSRLAMELARSEAVRQERLFTAGVAARATLEQARVALATAQADANARRIADRQANTNARPLAPINGIITQVGVVVGGIADPATPMVTIADLKEIGVQAEVPAAQLMRVGPGMAAQAKGPNGETVNARVLQVDPAVDPQTQRGKVLADVQNQAGHFKLSMFATLEIALGSHKGISVPAACVVDRGGQQVVYVMAKDGTAKQRPVVLGPSVEGQVEIRSGLTEGESIITEGAYQLTDGAKVTTTEPKADKADEGDKADMTATGAKEANDKADSKDSAEVKPGSATAGGAAERPGDKASGERTGSGAAAAKSEAP